MLSKNIRLFEFINCLLIAGGLAFAVAYGQPAAADEIVDRIVAVVNDDIVTYRELQKELAPYEEKIRAAKYSPEKEQQMFFKTRTEILNRMIDDKLVDQEAKESGIKFSEAEIDESIERVKASNLWTDEILRKAVESEGSTMDAYRETLRTNGTRAKLINKVVKSTVVITEEDARAYYQAHAEKYAGEVKYHLKNIYLMVPQKAGPSERQALLETMQRVYEDLKGGASFQQALASHAGPSVPLKSGDLGFVAFEDISPRLQPAVKYLAAGEFTPVVEMERVYQIFFVEDIARMGARSFEDVREDIELKLYNQFVDEKFRTWLEDLRKNSHIKIIL